MLKVQSWWNLSCSNEISNCPPGSEHLALGKDFVTESNLWSFFSQYMHLLKFLAKSPWPSRLSFIMLNKAAKQENKSPAIFPALSQVIHISIHMAFALSHLWKLPCFSLWQAVIVSSNTFLFQCWETFHYLLYQKNCFPQYISQRPEWKNAACLL